MKNLSNFAKINLLFLGVLSLLVGCEQPQPEHKEQVARPVKMYTVGESITGVTLRYPGSVSSIKETVLGFEVPGKVIKLNVKEGEFVEQGQVLAELDPQDYKAQLAGAQSDLEIAKSDYQRYEKAFKANAVTAQALQQAKRNRDVAQSAFNQANKALTDTKLIAPFSGRIVTKEIEQFTTVHAKQPIIQLHSESAYEMVVSVPESDWSQGEKVNSASEIKLNGQLFVTLSALPNEKFKGVISEFSGKADAVTRTYRVTVAFKATDNLPISSGMTGNVVYIDNGEISDDLSIPLEAIVGNSDNTAFVWLYDSAKGKVNKKAVKVTNITDTTAVVIAGLSKGDVIAVSGVHSLFDDYPVYPLKD